MNDIESNKGEIVMYQPDETIRLEVRVENESVWLTQQQITELFNRDRTVISRHINNVFKEGECDKESNVHFLHIPNSDKPVMYYSLDVIISVGYRVKSLNGTKFRKWANSVLKQYLLKGYAINQRIDNYIDVSTLTMLSNRAAHVPATIYTRQLSQQQQLDVQRHNQQYPPITINICQRNHDRFLIIDDVVYIFGASLKDAGKKLFAYIRMQETLAHLPVSMTTIPF